MTANFILDQVRGRKNIVGSGAYKLGETGFVEDRTKSGSNVYTNSGQLVEVMIVKATASLSSPAGKGVVFESGGLGQNIAAFSASGGKCDGIVDPDLTGNLSSGDTFLIFRKGMMNIIASGAISANAPFKPDNSGKFQAATTESVPTRCGRANAAATNDGDVIRALCDFTAA